MSLWDTIGRELYGLACLDGGPEHIYKPVIRLEYYEHDGEVRVFVGRCKGVEDLAGEATEYEIHSAGFDADAFPKALLSAIRKARANAMGEPRAETKR